MIPDLVLVIHRGQQERAAGFELPEHIILLEEREVVTRHEVRRVDEVRLLDEVLAEAQVRDGDGAGLLGVVDEVALRVVVGVLADDLDRVLVRPEAEEHRLVDLVLRGERRIEIQARLHHVVVDADGEVVLGLVLL